MSQITYRKINFPKIDWNEEPEKVLNFNKNALPYFNSDNCHGDNFYYPTLEKMEAAIDFWNDSYERKWFVRWAIIDKKFSKSIGSIELFHRIAEDDFNHVGVLRLDLRSDYENAVTINYS